MQSFFPVLEFIETEIELHNSPLIKGVRHEAICKLGSFGSFSGWIIGRRRRLRFGRQQSPVVEKKNLRGKTRRVRWLLNFQLGKGGEYGEIAGALNQKSRSWEQQKL